MTEECDDVYLTPEQVAERLQVCVETVYRWLGQRRLRGAKIGRKVWRISQGQLEEFMERCTNR